MKIRAIVGWAAVAISLSFVGVVLYVVFSIANSCFPNTCLDYVGELHVISGTVKVRHGGETTKTLRANDTLQMRSYHQITVSPDGSAEIIWRKYGRSVLAGGTELRIVSNQFTYRVLLLEVSVELVQGRIWTRLVEPLNKYEYFAVLSDRTVAATGGEALSGAPQSFGVSRNEGVVDVWAITSGVQALTLVESPPPDYWYLNVSDVLQYAKASAFARERERQGIKDFGQWERLGDLHSKLTLLPSRNSVTSSGEGLSRPTPLSEDQLQDPFILEGNSESAPWWAFWKR